jgi:hypothetical protein
MEAAIGIEPMNKGFAEIFSRCSQKNIEGQVGQGQQLNFFRVLPWPSVNAGVYYIFYYSKLFREVMSVSKLLSKLEAAIGIEPMVANHASCIP